MCIKCQSELNALSAPLALLQVAVAALEALRACVRVFPHALEAALERTLPVLFMRVMDQKEQVKILAMEVLQGELPACSSVAHSQQLLVPLRKLPAVCLLTSSKGTWACCSSLHSQNVSQIHVPPACKQNAIMRKQRSQTRHS